MLKVRRNAQNLQLNVTNKNTYKNVGFDDFEFRLQIVENVFV
jgi:hypothetical protein